jgi:hypothetical protein
VTSTAIHQQDSVFKRILWLYGLHTLLSNAFTLIGYYLLPEGVFRGTALTFAGEVAAAPKGFWGEFAVTVLFNLGIVAALGVAATVLAFAPGAHRW